MNWKSVGTLKVFALLLLMACAACTSLPPAQVATDTKAIVGKWDGYILLRGTGNNAATLQFFDDGRFVGSVAGWPESRGTVKVVDGKYRMHSETRNVGSTLTLHGDGGERVLTILTDDGHSGQYRPAK